jgi:hypothetical protein
VPAQYTLVSDAELHRLRNPTATATITDAQAAAWVKGKLEEAAKKVSVSYSAKAISLYQRMHGVFPGVGHAALSTGMVASGCALLDTMGLGDALTSDAAVEGVATLCPGYTSLSRFLAYDRLQLQAELKEALSKRSYVFLGNDKGCKKGISHMPKILMYWGGSRVVSRTCDCDAAANDTTESTLDIIQSLSVYGLGPNNHHINSGYAHEGFLEGLTTDSGGGGTGYCAARSYAEHGLARADESMTVATCMMHANNVLLSNPWPKYYGDGGITVSNGLQLLHSVFDLQSLFKWSKMVEFKALWLAAGCESPPPKRMSEPLVTRWWHSTTGARHVLPRWEEWRKFCMYVADGHKNTEGTTYKQATKLACDLKQPSIRCDVGFLGGLGRSYFDEEFLFQQQPDSWSKSHGHRAHRQLYRSCKMHRDWSAIAGKLEAHEHFKEFRSALDELPAESTTESGGALPSQPLKRDLAARYLADGAGLIDKHTLRWRTNNAWLGLGDEPVLGRTVARFLLGLPGDDVRVVRSDVHGCDVDVGAYMTFLLKEVGGARLGYNKSWVKSKHAAAVAEMANAGTDAAVDLQGGASLSLACLAFKEEFQKRALPLLSSTQPVEAAVRESALAAMVNRTEATRSAYAAERSFGILAVNAEIKRKWADEEAQEEEQEEGEEAQGGSKRKRVARKPNARPKGRAVAVGLVKKALEFAPTEQELRAVRQLALKATSVDLRQEATLVRSVAAYAAEVKKTRTPTTKGRKPCADKTASVHTLTIVAGSVPDAQKIREQTKFNRSKVVDELMFRNVQKEHYESADDSKLKLVLEEHCQLKAYPGWFQWQMPLSLRDVHDDASTRVKTLLSAPLRVEAQTLGVVDTGKVEEVRARVVAQMLVRARAAIPSTERGGLGV